MKAYQPIWSVSLNGIGIAVVINNFWSIPVLGATLGPIQFPVLINNTQVGQVKVLVECVAIDCTQNKRENRASDAPTTLFESTNSTKRLASKTFYAWYKN